MKTDYTEKIISKYGKDFFDIIHIKNNYFAENNKFLEQEKYQRDYYKKQDIRKMCKICCTTLKIKLFDKFEIPYFICDNCGHLNGGYQDSKDFVLEIYGPKYAENYHVKKISEYKERVNKIYIPKAKFLLDSLDKIGIKHNQLDYVDFGAGSGYFTSSLKKLGINNVRGFEPSEVQVAYGNKMNKSNDLEVLEFGKEIPLLESISCDVISMIGVLEHLQNPTQIMSAIVKNKKIRFIYISVPMFSLTVFFELIFDKVWSRQLSGGHTHLFTESSLGYLFDKFNLKKISEWWFGTDLLDLYRSMSILLEKHAKTTKEEFEIMMRPLMNPMQLIIDKKHLSSEVHLLLKKSS